MSDASLARRTKIRAYIDGADATQYINEHLISLIYTDNEADPDDLQLVLEDVDGILLTKWLNINASDIKLSAAIIRENWNSDGKDDMLETGAFVLDDIDPKGPPSTVTLKATALPYSSTVRQTKKSKGWEKYKLSSIGKEIAKKNGLSVMYDSVFDPMYDRVEQVEESDFSFLSRLSYNAGIALKATNNILVFFDAAAFEKKPSVITIERATIEAGAKGKYGKYNLRWAKADTQYNACRVKYTDASGKALEYTYRIKPEGQTYEVTAKVKSIGEAEKYAKAALRQKNKFEITGNFTIPGDTRLVAGVTVELKGWGRFDRKYIIEKATHTVQKSSGYDVSIDLRMALEGY